MLVNAYYFRLPALVEVRQKEARKTLEEFGFLQKILWLGSLLLTGDVALRQGK
jgi:hypothetical protein